MDYPEADEPPYSQQVGRTDGRGGGPGQGYTHWSQRRPIRDARITDIYTFSIQN